VDGKFSSIKTSNAIDLDSIPKRISSTNARAIYAIFNCSLRISRNTPCNFQEKYVLIDPTQYDAVSGSSTIHTFIKDLYEDLHSQ
jgi:hypothetical protein